MTTLKETVRIHSPLEKVYAIAEDRKRWDSWWVGCREEKITWGGHSTSLALLVPFPLTERVLEDRIDADGARWKVKSERDPQRAGASIPRALLCSWAPIRCGPTRPVDPRRDHGRD